MQDWPRLALDCHYRVSEIVEKLNVTVHELRSFCKRTLGGITPKQWLRELRLAEARVLLAAGNSTEDVARVLSYTDAAHFSNEFRRVHGMSPQVWRRRNREFNAEAQARSIRLPALPPPRREFIDESKFPWLGFAVEEARETNRCDT